MATICSTNGGVHTPQARRRNAISLSQTSSRLFQDTRFCTLPRKQGVSWPKHSSEERFLNTAKAFLSCPLLSQVSALCCVAQMARCCMCTSTAVRFGVGYMELATLLFS